MSTDLQIGRGRGRSAAVCVALWAMALLSGLCCHRPFPSKPNILWITVDSLRPDHLGCAGYERAHTPHIDGLAAEGVLFTQCIAQAPYTHISVPSMITGKYPLMSGVRTSGQDLASEQVTLAEMLAPRGYLTVVVPMLWKSEFNQGFEVIYPASLSTLQKTQWCLEALDTLDQRPFFIWLYYWDPHVPYTPPADFMKTYESDYTGKVAESDRRPQRIVSDQDLRDETGLYRGIVQVLNRINEGQMVLAEKERAHLVNLYDAEIALVDSQIGRVLTRLRELGLWDNTLVILNADHGEGFGEHDRYYHGLTLYEDQVRVPLLLKPPHAPASGQRVTGPVRNMDIFPTILDYCAIAPAKDLSGTSLRRFIEEDMSPNLPTYLETSGFWKGKGSEFQLVGYRTDGYKLIFDLFNQSTQLYQLQIDPGEKDNLLIADQPPAWVKEKERELRQQLLAALGVKRPDDLKLSLQDMLLDRAATQQLKALGYIE